MILAFALMLAAQDPQPDCTDAMSQAEINACAALDFEQADAELNRLWPSLIEDARAADREIDRRYDQLPGYEEVLRDAQRAWIAFRDAQCTDESYAEARGGSMAPMVYSNCLARMTRERIAQLSPAERP